MRELDLASCLDNVCPDCTRLDDVCDCNVQWNQQSEEDSGATIEKHGLVSFVTASEAPSVGLGAGNHVFSASDQTLDTDIEGWFRRPVRINEFTWSEADVAGFKTSITPWSLWMNNAFVKTKLNNYSWIRGDLKIKVQVTASPFYYGMLQMSYIPIPTFSPSTIVNDAALRYLIPMSQRPHIVIEPGKSDSYEMTLPFFLQKNWMNVQSLSEAVNMGTINSHIYSSLKSANGAVGIGISVVTYAWMENIELSGASVGLSMQSDEYGEGCVSRPASQVASAASYFESIPIIGPFATATRIGAGAISAIASMFGFTNVPVIEDTRPVRNTTFPQLASAEIAHTVEKLTLDPKNELSVDPRIVGMPSGQDEMMISRIAQHESYLTTIPWTSAEGVDAMKFWTRVNPYLYDSDGAAQAKLYLTPMAYAAKVFDHWRGNIIFRFHIIASKYHKGKVLINFDPTGYSAQNIGNTVSTSNVVHTTIIDIGETQDVEFEVPYQQAAQFLALRTVVTAADKGWAVNTVVPGVYPVDNFYDNGFLTMRVLNTLTAPEAITSVDILVYVRAGAHVEFANPCEVDTSHTLSFYAPQSETYPDNTNPDSTMLAPTRGPIDDQYSVHFGENIRSFRQLLRRYELVQTERIGALLGANTTSVIRKRFYKMPISPGYCSVGGSTANLIVGVGNAPYNYATMTLLSYLAQSFVCYRGSVNWTYNLYGATTVYQTARVAKDNLTGLVASTGITTYSLVTASQAAAHVNQRLAGRAGSSMINSSTQSGLNVQCPMYTAFKFQSTSCFNANQGQIYDGSVLDCFVLEIDANQNSGLNVTTNIHSYCSIGTDFGLHFFLNVPTFYVYSTVPPPV